MNFTTLNETEFESFARNHPMGNFHQTIGWAKLKGVTGWTHNFIGIKKDGKVIAGSLILEKKLPLGLKFFYAPRGFLIDYDDTVLLDFFISHLKTYAKKKHAIFVKIDPYVILHERNIDGNIVPGGIDHTQLVEHLKRLGFLHNGYTLDMEDLQPRWTFALDLKGKTVEEVFQKIDLTRRHIINKNKENGVTTRTLEMDEMELFKEMMQHTADRRGFIDRPLSYYKNMKKFLKDDAQFIIAEGNLPIYLKQIEKEMKENERAIEDKKYDMEHNSGKINLKKAKNKLDEMMVSQEVFVKKKLEIEAIMKEKGEKIVLGGMVFLFQKRGVISLFGGSYQEYMKYFLSNYTTNWNMIEFAIKQGYEKYNFYGISGDFKNKKNEMYGLYNFKRGFGGYVEEYIGEFDLVLSKPKYRMYLLALKAYGKWKNRGK